MNLNQRNKKSIATKINTFIGLFAILFLIICFFSTKDLYSGTYEIMTPIEPITVAKLEDGSKEYFFDLRDYGPEYTGIMFYTAHQIVEGFNGGRSIYSFNVVSDFWASSPGVAFNLIEINERMVQIAVVIKPAYDIVDDQKIDFYIGSAYAMYDGIMTDSMPRFIASLLIVIFSITIFLYYTFMHEKANLNKNLLYLSFFSFFAGIWSLNETDAATLLVRNKVFEYLIPYVCLMMIIPPFVKFFDSYLELNSKYMRKIISAASMIQLCILTILHVTKIAEYRETLVFMQLGIFIAALYLVCGMIYQIIHKNYSRHLKICVIGLSLFFVAIIADIIQFYRTTGDADKLGRYMFLVFVCLLAWDMIRDAYEIIEKGRQAKKLEIFALTDSMTGLFNRNAFESQANTDKPLDDIVAVVADANGLKKCNDTYGHDAGDEYITVVANIFNEVYGKYGNCYRTGGDEFCCIITSAKHVNLERLRKLFFSKIYAVNLEGDYMFNIGVALGDAYYDSELDGDFRGLVKRADARMYENKKLIKGQIS